MSDLLKPISVSAFRLTPTGITVLLVISAVCVYLAPLAMPPGYSWLSHSISESAAQGLQYAWIARLGFVCFGLAVLWLTIYRSRFWALAVFWMQLVFAVCMLGTAAFSHKPWLAGIPTDNIEDLLHSITATVMGFAFAIGVVARFLQRDKHRKFARSMDVMAILAATLLTPIGMAVPGLSGLLQRVMFAIAYTWFIYEATDLKGGSR